MHQYVTSRFTWIVLLAASLIFLSALLTRYIQEDAFIYFRTAENLAHHNAYSFNLGANYPGATSTFYALKLSVLISLFGDFYKIVLQFLNFSLGIFSIWVLVSSFRERIDRAQFASFVILLMLCPPFVRLTFSGMETAWVLVCICGLVYGFTRLSVGALVASSVLIPLIRPEAGVVSLIAAVLLLLSKRYYIGLSVVFALSAGFAIAAGVTYAMTGTVLPGTITAKAISYDPSLSPGAMVYRVFENLFNGNLTLGLETKFFPEYFYASYGLVILVFLAFRFWESTWRAGIRPREWRADALPILIVASFVVGYAVGGVVFPWYFWPSSILIYFLLIKRLVESDLFSGVVEAVIYCVVGGLAAVNFILLINYGYQESGYRADVGRYIGENFEKQETLFLEPAGYIPYYSGMRTYDTVGLVDPKILEYRDGENARWWITFVRDVQPTVIVDRSPVHLAQKSNREMTAADFMWFKENYETRKRFQYRAYLEKNRNMLTPLLGLGGHSDYYVYELVARKRE